MSKKDRLQSVTKILATILFILIIPFYFGYGLPIPNLNLSFVENLWLTIFPVFISGLLIGWKWEKLAGYMITIPILIGVVSTFCINEDPSIALILPFTVGIMYLVCGYKK